MGICWYCYWGWSAPVRKIYNEALKKLDGNESVLEFGPSHVVWSDENFESAEWCLEHFDENHNGFMKDDLDVCRWSLEELSKIPIDIRCIEPKEYDEENPENYPPKVEVMK